MNTRRDPEQLIRGRGAGAAALLLSLVLMLLASALALVLFEVFMQARDPGPVMRVSSSAYGEFDPHLGVRYTPGSQLSFAYVDRQGRVLDCIEGLSRTNRDGFRGRDTLQDHGSPAVRLRLIATGDSFSH